MNLFVSPNKKYPHCLKGETKTVSPFLFDKNNPQGIIRHMSNDTKKEIAYALPFWIFMLILILSEVADYFGFVDKL